MSTEQLTGCFVDVFDLSRYRGRRRRLMGPAQFNEIRSRSQTWGISIDSLIAGPQAMVRFFLALEPDGTSVWIMPRQSLPDLRAFKIDDELDSVEILAEAPKSGQPGYTAFIIAMENIREPHA